MSDLVERLRKQAWQRSGAPKMDAGHTKMLEWEAADEIERLEGLLKNEVALGYEMLSDQIQEKDAEIERLLEATPDRYYEVNAWCDRLQAEIERLTEQLHYANGTCDLAMKHRDAAEAEIERLRASVKELASRLDETRRWEVIETLSYDGRRLAVRGESGETAKEEEKDQ
jgi:chromosome segregation ATPase